MLFNLFDDLTQAARTPLTIYQILRSAAYDSSKSILEEPTIDELISDYKSVIFNFTYDMTCRNGTTVVDSDWFEESILRHYLKRRIGFETLQQFRWELENKFNDKLQIWLDKYEAFDNLLMEQFAYGASEYYTKTGTNTSDLNHNLEGSNSGTGSDSSSINKSEGHVTTLDNTNTKSSTFTVDDYMFDSQTTESEGSYTGGNSIYKRIKHLNSVEPEVTLSNSGESEAFISDLKYEINDTTEETSGTNTGNNSNSSEIRNDSTETHTVSTTVSGTEKNKISTNGTLSDTLTNESTNTASTSNTDETSISGYTIKSKSDPETMTTLYRMFDGNMDWLSMVFDDLDELFLSIVM